ncbi:DUF1328 domain-containing protein [Legionella anisa]|uniref:UPF0391 membrane protein A6J39_006060 n=1 Tax=Legionella anisa TaxID=28082 RepID=A0AAX0WR81_9GAMM|nr:DUF1328 family protein [Legionella anisa]AWN75279.1 DUF1328 domain-containing protein [Legionella anisa]KTC72641.1 hypothetical protein Lani_0865 [Legionella anisa]MBN5935458.1 DUF1328 domain-containing protein [Legionella anisa]MCW8424550.1 DUF1328 domain-containing protein [Legionella anisa]MCW8446332.1 DUF1328 domain-containing protein [Legionella anisa]
MLTGAFVFLVIAILSAIYRFTGTNPTLIVIAKIIFYLSLAAFCILLIVYVLNSAPPLPEDKNNLPL